MRLPLAPFWTCLALLATAHALAMGRAAPDVHAQLIARDAPPAPAPQLGARGDAAIAHVRRAHDARAGRRVRRACKARSTSNGTAAASASTTAVTSASSVAAVPISASSSAVAALAEVAPTADPSASASTTLVNAQHLAVSSPPVAPVVSSSATVATSLPFASASPSPAPAPSASPAPSPSPSPATGGSGSGGARVSVDPSGTDGPFSGHGTWYDVGLGSCGWTDTPDHPIVAVSDQLMNTWPGATANPNLHPLCGKHLQITWGGKTALARVADTCPGCALRSLDMSKGLFEQFASLDVGLLAAGQNQDIVWSWVAGSGDLPSVPV